MSMYLDDVSSEDFSGLWAKRDQTKRGITIQFLVNLIGHESSESGVVGFSRRLQLLEEAEIYSEFAIRNLYKKDFEKLVLKESENAQ